MEVRIIEDTPRVIWADGEIDLSNADLLDEALKEAVRDCPKGFVVDFSEATYLDSAGIQAVLGAHREMMDTGGKIAVVITRQTVREILDIISADQLPNFFICDNMESAKRAASEAAAGKD